MAGGARENARDLSQEERKVLQCFFAHSTLAKQAYALRERLTAIFDTNLTKKQAQAKIRSWQRQVQKSGLKCFEAFLKLLQAWWDEITNFFIQRESNGFVEGFNNKVKVLKRLCYPGTARQGKCGIFNLQHLFQRISLDLQGYRLLAGTPIYG